MVTQATSFGRTGINDWVVQRVSAVILAAYSLFLVGFCLIVDVDYSAWRGLFDQTWMQIFTLLALLATCAHAWIGMWIIGTDYLRPHMAGDSATMLRAVYQIGCTLLILVYLIWGIKIVWGF